LFIAEQADFYTTPLSTYQHVYQYALSSRQQTLFEFGSSRTGMALHHCVLLSADPEDVGPERPYRTPSTRDNEWHKFNIFLKMVL
jgi:hypothetical protein